jgi:hypothetical protein
LKKTLLIGRGDKIHFAAFPIPDNRHVALKTRGLGLGLKEPDHRKLIFFRFKRERTRHWKNNYINTRRLEVNNFIGWNKNRLSQQTKADKGAGPRGLTAGNSLLSIL